MVHVYSRSCILQGPCTDDAVLNMNFATSKVESKDNTHGYYFVYGLVLEVRLLEYIKGGMLHLHGV